MMIVKWITSAIYRTRAVTTISSTWLAWSEWGRSAAPPPRKFLIEANFMLLYMPINCLFMYSVNYWVNLASSSETTVTAMSVLSLAFQSHSFCFQARYGKFLWGVKRESIRSWNSSSNPVFSEILLGIAISGNILTVSFICSLLSPNCTRACEFVLRWRSVKYSRKCEWIMMEGRASRKQGLLWRLIKANLKIPWFRKFDRIANNFFWNICTHCRCFSVAKPALISLL